MKYISERIVNISELEKHIQNAEFNFNVLSDEMKKTAPSKTIIDGATYQVAKSLEIARNYEFQIEKRICDFKDVSVSQISLENHKVTCNQD